MKIYKLQVSNLETWETLLKVDINPSSWLFAWGHNVLVLWYLVPSAANYPWSSYDAKGGPFSKTMLFGIPYELKNCSSTKATFLVELLLINSMLGYFVRCSMITNIY